MSLFTQIWSHYCFISPYFICGMFSLIPFFGFWNWNWQFYGELVFKVERFYETRFECWKFDKQGGVVIRAKRRRGVGKISKINRRWGGGDIRLIKQSPGGALQKVVLNNFARFTGKQLFRILSTGVFIEKLFLQRNSGLPHLNLTCHWSSL